MPVELVLPQAFTRCVLTLSSHTWRIAREGIPLAGTLMPARQLSVTPRLTTIAVSTLVLMAARSVYQPVTRVPEECKHTGMLLDACIECLSTDDLAGIVVMTLAFLVHHCKIAEEFLAEPQMVAAVAAGILQLLHALLQVEIAPVPGSFTCCRTNLALSTFNTLTACQAPAKQASAPGRDGQMLLQHRTTPDCSTFPTPASPDSI